MVSFTINFEVMSKALPNETCRGLQKMKRRDTTTLKTNGFKMNIPFEKVSNVSSTS